MKEPMALASVTREWYLNNQRHREDGPAIEWADGTREWCVNGQWHRTDGPAFEDPNGDRSWYLNGDELIFQTWLDRVAKSPEERMGLWMRWG